MAYLLYQLVHEGSSVRHDSSSHSCGTLGPSRDRYYVCLHFHAALPCLRRCLIHEAALFNVIARSELPPHLCRCSIAVCFSFATFSRATEPLDASLVHTDNFIKVLSDTTANPNSGGVGIRQWTWQTCSQVRGH